MNTPASPAITTLCPRYVRLARTLQLFVLTALGLLEVFAAQAASLAVGALRTEYRIDPVGLDVAQPRLSWVVTSPERGQKQTAYQVRVASSRAGLAAERANLWDSGVVRTNQTIHVMYAGKKLGSRAQAWWKVRVWDRAGAPSPWSSPAFWTMGLLEPTDWQAQWIADPQSPAKSSPKGPLNGYHSEIAKSAETAKWVVLDLGESRQVDAVRLYPARPYDWQPDKPGFLFPLRFRLDGAEKPDFTDTQVLVDRTQEDVSNPGTNALLYAFTLQKARYVRLTATKLARRDAQNFALALAEIQVLAVGENVASGAKVTALDSIETGAWAKANLVDGVLVTVSAPAASPPLPATMVRKMFTLDQPVRRATAYVTGLGLYELRINGQRVGDRLLAPEWTNYRKRIQYQIYDVTALLRTGDNAIAAELGEGWYAGRLMAFGRDAYGSTLRFLCQVEIEFAEGTSRTVATDGSWRTSTDGPIRSSGIYDGEVYDARREMPGWDAPGFDDSAWHRARVQALDGAQLVWQRNEPIRVMQELKPTRATNPKPGVFIFDCGQNMVGWCRLQVQGPAGTTVTLRHGEMLNDDGTLYTANLRGAPQIDRFTLRGNGPEILEPHFTYHGFRYLEVTGLSEAPRSDAVTGKVFYSSAPDASHFECSNPRINQLMHNIYWTQRANLMSSPTDCPQRDERFGWMGDIQAFSQTAIFNMDMAGFFSKWVRDIRDDQARDGRYPDFAPHPGDPGATFSGVPAWGDAGTVVPWRMYQNYADLRLLSEHFESAKRWVEYIHGLNPDLIWSKGRNNDYNDWLNGDTLIQTGWPRTGGAVPQEEFATAFFAHSTEIVAKMAQALGLTREADTYQKLFAGIKRAFNQRFVDAEGRIRGETQASYALALHFNLLPDDRRAPAARRMVEGFKRYNGHLSTGIQSSHRLMLELSRNGYQDEAYRILNLKDFPSWGMMVENGATTIWERWDGFVKGRGFQDAGMNSFNHWAFGAIGEWVWRQIAGINPDESMPGYKHFTIAPRPGGGLDWAKSDYTSIRGRIVSAWRIENQQFQLDVSVPANTTATVILPASDATAIKENESALETAEGILRVQTTGKVTALDIDSGQYSFRLPWRGSGR